MRRWAGDAKRLEPYPPYVLRDLFPEVHSVAISVHLALDNHAILTQMQREEVASGCDLLRPDFPRVLVLQAPRPTFPGELKVIRPSGDWGDIASVS